MVVPVERIGEMRNTYGICNRKTRKKRQIGKPRYMSEDSNKIDSKAIE